MNKSRQAYEPPKAMVYWFDENDQILTASGTVSAGPTANYAANALNQFMGGTNTTIE